MMYYVEFLKLFKTVKFQYAEMPNDIDMLSSKGGEN